MTCVGGFSGEVCFAIPLLKSDNARDERIVVRRDPLERIMRVASDAASRRSGDSLLLRRRFAADGVLSLDRVDALGPLRQVAVGDVAPAYVYAGLLLDRLGGLDRGDDQLGVVLDGLLDHLVDVAA